MVSFLKTQCSPWYKASSCLPYFGGLSNSSHTILLDCLFLYSNSVRFAESRQNFLPNIKFWNFLISSALSSTSTCYSPMQTSTFMALQTVPYFTTSRKKPNFLSMLVTGGIQAFSHLPLQMLGTHLAPVLEQWNFNSSWEGFLSHLKSPQTNIFVTF